MPKRTLTIASISSEVAPYSKTGGLADVAKALPKALATRGHTVTIFTPYYKFVAEQNLELRALPTETKISVGNRKYPIHFGELKINVNLSVVFVCCNELLGRRAKVYGYPDDNLRFLVFNLAVLRYLELTKKRPHIIHCHDWQTGLIPYFLKQYASRYPSLKKSASLFTIHNLAFQTAGDWWRKKERDNGRFDPLKNTKRIKSLNFTKRAIVSADIINTVSERYAEEITTPEFGQHLDKYLRGRKHDLYGIINGIDYNVHNPAVDPYIACPYDWNTLPRKKKNKLELQKFMHIEENADIPILGATNRLTEQKGFSLIIETINVLMQLRLQVVIMGDGFKEYIAFFKRMAKKYPKKIAIFTPFNEKIESKIYAGADMFLMPSRFEPCGISQLKSLRYGAIPIVHETGGLSDTISNFNPHTKKGNGFVFKNYQPEYFLVAVTRALENYQHRQSWEALTARAMQQTYSWELPAKKYIKLYRIALKQRHKKR